MAAFLVCTAYVLSVQRAASPASGQVTLRLGHWLLHAGMREAFNEAIAGYTQLHPHVRIEQIAVPIRAYPAWQRTRHTGGTAPDLTGILNLGEDLVSRHFIPLTDRLAEPNPYNAGTALEGVPWEHTFVDGLAAMRGLTATSGEVHAVNLQINTMRLYYNVELLHAVTGAREPPADFAALLALGEAVARYNRTAPRPVVPIASCGPYAQMLYNALVPSQTQRLALHYSASRNLLLTQAEVAALFLSGQIDYRTPAIRSGLELMREVTALMPPGFNQLQRDDALFAFLQQQAVMFYAGSWDYGVLVRDGPFTTGIARLPMPARDHPRYGPHTLGLPSEAAGSPEATLGIARTTAHPELALDFLRYLTSRPVAEMFSRRSHRIAAIVDARPPPDALGLAPQLDGEVAGFPIDFVAFSGRSAFNAFQRDLHLLLGQRGDTDAFVERLSVNVPPALRLDMQQHLNRMGQDVQRLDALAALAHLAPPSATLAAPASRHLEMQHTRQAERQRLGRSLLPPAAPVPSPPPQS